MIKNRIYIAMLAMAVVTLHCGVDFAALEKSAKEGDQGAIEKLLTTLKKDEASNNRAKAATALGNAGVKSAYPALVERFENDDDIVRAAAIKALGQTGDREAFPALLKVYNGATESEDIRLQALDGIGYVNSPQAKQILFSALASGIYAREKIAIQAFGRQKTKEAVSPLIAKLDTSMNDVDIWNALKEINDPSAESGLIVTLDKRIDNYDFSEDATIAHIDTLANLKSKKAQPSLVKLFLTLEEGHAVKQHLAKILKDAQLTQSYALVTASSLNLREKTNTRAAIVDNLPGGTLAEILEKSEVKYTVDGKEDYWYKVRRSGKNPGWIFGGYVQVFDPQNIQI